MIVCDTERIALCNNEINEFCCKLKFFSFEIPNMEVANSQFDNSKTMNNEESELACCINKLTTKRREQLNLKNPECMYFVVKLSDDSFHKIKIKLDYCLCLIQEFNKQKSKSRQSFRGAKSEIWTSKS